MFEADGSRGVSERYLLDAKGHQRPFPILDGHVDPVEDIVDGSMRSESGQLRSLASADAPCVLVDRLTDVFGRIMVSPLWSRMSLLAEVSVETWPSRDASRFKMLTIVLRRVRMG